MSRSELDSYSDLSDVTLALIGAFKNAYRSVERRKGRESQSLVDGAVTQAQVDLLIQLRKRGPTAVGELASSNGLSAASVSQMVDRLSEQGHVERVRSETDRRVVNVELSKKGVAAIDPIFERWRENWKKALAGVPDQDLQTASAVLERIASVYGEPDEGVG